MAIELKVPELGESVTEVEVGEWLKEEGEQVGRDETLVVLESDKASLEIPSPKAGILARIVKQQGERARIGDVLGEIEEGETSRKALKDDAAAEPESGSRRAKLERPRKRELARSAASKPGGEDELPARSSSQPDRESLAAKKEASQERAEPIEGEPGAAPAVRKLLEEHGLDASKLEGTGKGGRILKEDVLRHVEKRAREPSPGRDEPEVRTDVQDREEELVPMSTLRRRIAERLVEAQRTSALLTTFNEIDMSEVKALRKELGDRFRERHRVKLGLMSFFVKAVIEALRGVPLLNAEIRDTKIAYRNYFDIGIAVGSGKGLVVPVLRNAERMSFAELETSIADFSTRAQNGKLEPPELQGGTFTITNGGIFGSLLSTPIVNPPQSGILGLHAIQDRPVAREGAVEIRPMMYVALTYDHRLVDGREAVTFLRSVKEKVERPARMLLEV